VVNADRVMALLTEACAMLDASGDHAAAAHVGQAMTMVAQRHGVALPSGDARCGQPD